MTNKRAARRVGVATSRDPKPNYDVIEEHTVRTPLLLGVPEAAKLLSISPTTLRELINRGEVPTVRLGRRLLIAYSDLETIASSGL